MNTLDCRGCGSTIHDPDAPDNPPSPDACEHCPPRTCDQCGDLDHVTAPCSCWVSVGDIPAADLKAMLARDGLGIATDGTLHTERTAL